MMFPITVDFYQYDSVKVGYEKIYPWKIPIKFINTTYMGIKKINVEIKGETSFNIIKLLKDIVEFFSNQRWTAALSKSPFKVFNLKIEIKPDDKFIIVNGKEYDNDGLHWRGCCNRNLFLNGFIHIEISPKACNEIVDSLLNERYEIKRQKEAWEKWTTEGWIKHTLAHEIAHFMCIPLLNKKWSSLDEILAQIFACHYDLHNKPYIHVPSGQYLKDHLDRCSLNANNSWSCSQRLIDVFINPIYWDTEKKFLILQDYSML